MPPLEAARATEAAFVEDVCRHPGDDAPRLIYADWLDEHGQAERAEFVRVQCELAGWKPYRPPPEIEEIAGSGRLYAAQARELIAEKKAEHEARHGALCRRERELLEDYRLDWARQLHPDGFRCDFHRGFIEEITLPAAAFMEHAAALFRAAPVRRVTLSDKEPEYFRIAADDFALLWFRETSTTQSPAHLPGVLYDLLPPGTHRLSASYRSECEAKDALAAACLLYGRRVAWPCPRCGGGKGRPDRHPFDPDLACPACAGRGHTVEEG